MPLTVNGGPRRRRRAGFPARYSAAGLFRQELSRKQWPRAWAHHPVRSSYDVVIVGGGVHGLLHCERSSGRYLFDALVSVGHDFGIEIDGFRVPGI